MGKQIMYILIKTVQEEGIADDVDNPVEDDDHPVES